MLPDIRVVVFWVYRAVRNPIAKKKWLTFCSVIALVGFLYSIYKIYSGADVYSTLLVLSIFLLMIFLYTVITLGKPRYYYLNDEIVYKPFKTPLSNVEGFEVDYENRVIRLKLKRPSMFAVKTLYFENDEDLEEVARHLRLRRKS